MPLHPLEPEFDLGGAGRGEFRSAPAGVVTEALAYGFAEAEILRAAISAPDVSSGFN